LKKWKKKKKQMKPPKIIISGGGTGGHVFPAIAIANAIKAKQSDAEILFVGALGKIEMEKVPQAGYEIIGLDIKGLQRKISFDNLKFPIRLLKSLWKSSSILKSFKADVAVGVGGYASGPLLYMASRNNIPYVIQEQNSYPGITNKLLAKKASKICVAYEGMDQFFPANTLMYTGNPVRAELLDIQALRVHAIEHFGLDVNKKTIFITGGSLGARTLNESVLNFVQEINSSDVQLIWQTGRFYYSTIVENAKEKFSEGVKIFEFISSMDMAYAAADLIIARAGAGTISELCLVGKPVVLVPSPNVAEDHQTKNAMALVKNNAAVLVKDANAKQELIPKALELLKNKEQLESLSAEIKKLAMPNAADIIADEVLKLVKR
jgi:UDP-N-acetylglucosamine--N-acetylmuramyl-(pentapeptide) pyrophosphoryl-undecaprenol N-acetylglucosamine transferase